MSEVKSFKLVSSVLIDRILKDQCVSAAQLDQLSKASSPDFLHFVCTALPGPASECVFVELETPEGNGSGLGEWITRPDGLVALVVPNNHELRAQRLRADTAEAELKVVRKSREDELENYNALIADHAAAEQRIADTTAKLQLAIDMLDDDERGNRFAQALRIAIAALNPNPEVESHEKH